MYTLRADGTLDTYRFVQQTGSLPNPTWSYVKDDRGPYSTLTVAVSCTSASGTWVCTPTAFTENLPKGMIRRFAGVQALDSFGNPYNYNLITQEQDSNGNTVTYSWTTLSNQDKPYIASVTDPVGRVTTYGYEVASQVCVRETQAGACTQWVYFYRVKTVTNPYGVVATYTYSSSGATWILVSVLNAAGFTTRYGYYPGGPLNSVTDARNLTTTITWAVLTRVGQVTAPDTTSRTYSYTTDSSGNVTSTAVTDARNNVTRYAITGARDVGSITDPLGNVTSYVYDTHHNVTQITDARGVITTMAYNARNKPTQIIRASGSLNLTTIMTWDGNDNLLSVTNPRNIVTNYTYDTRNNLTSVRRAVGTPDEALTQYTYTTWGGVATATDPLMNTTTYAYTARRQIQQITPPAGGGGPTTFGYDASDNQTTVTDGNSHTWTAAYNAQRLPTSAADPSGNTARYAYDPNGNRTSVTDPKNQVTAFHYDSRNRLDVITDPFNATTGYGYDAVGNLIRVTNTRNLATLFAYDAANRLTQTTDALGQVTRYGYDQVGNRTSLIDRKGVTTTYTYDQANRLTQVSAGGMTVSYGYDPNGNRQSMVDPLSTTTYTYDNLDRWTGTSYPDGRLVQVIYDQASNRTGLLYPDGTTSLAYAYDPANRLTQVTQGTLGWTFAYDGAGNRTSMTQPNGTQTTYTYQVNNWLSNITHQNAAGPLLTIAYTYDANGNRISQVDSAGTTTFTYDALNRLTQAAYPGTYGTWSWTYDPVGNRTSQSAPSGQTTYTYDNNNRLTQAGSTTYTYDANGNLTGTSAGQSFTYDPFNRMTQASGPGGTAAYAYNGDGRKLQRVGPDGTTLYYYDGIRPIWEADGTGAKTAQLDRDLFGNLLSRAGATGTRVYYHTDGLGSTVALTDSGGNVAGAMLYDAWGNVRASGADVGKYRFTGAELDAASGLYHMGARFYDPTIGRWLSEDPAGSSNSYAYVANNPLIHTDPTGLHGGLSGLGELAWDASGHNVADFDTWERVAMAGPAPGLGWEAYMGFVNAAAQKYGVDPALTLAVMTWENRGSKLNPSGTHINPNGTTDVGLMQINLETTGKQYNVTLEQLKDPSINIDVGTHLLHDLRGAVHGRLENVVAAYNEGIGNFNRFGIAGPPGYDVPGYVGGVMRNYEYFRGNKCGGLCP